MLRVLLTNDDGIEAEGLRALAACLAPRCEVLVVAPSSPQGAKSHSVTLHKPVRLQQVNDYVHGADAAHFAAYGCSGTPADCVMLGALHLWQANPPHLVISGINDGENVAQDLSYSGTVGGALEGACCHVPSLALSAAAYQPHHAADNARAAELVITLLLYNRPFAHQCEMARAWLQNGAGDDNGIWRLPKCEEGERAESYPAPGRWFPPALDDVPCLNINLPEAPVMEIKGIIWTRAGKREYQDVVKAGVDPRGKDYYWVAGDKVLLEDEHAGTDTHAIANGYVTVTPVSYDRTDLRELKRLREWQAERE
jgi:5'-nucleotidase